MDWRLKKCTFLLMNIIYYNEMKQKLMHEYYFLALAYRDILSRIIKFLLFYLFLILLQIFQKNWKTIVSASAREIVAICYLFKYSLKLSFFTPCIELIPLLNCDQIDSMVFVWSPSLFTNSFLSTTTEWRYPACCNLL